MAEIGDTTFKIKDAGKHEHFTMLPNIVFTMGLSAYSLALYAVLKRVAGEDGECWYSAEKLGVMGGMTRTTIYSTLENLQEAGLIHVEKKTREGGGGWPLNFITIVDIWQRNREYFEARSLCDLGQGSHTTVEGSHTTVEGRHTDTEEDLFKKIKEEENTSDTNTKTKDFSEEEYQYEDAFLEATEKLYGLKECTLDVGNVLYDKTMELFEANRLKQGKLFSTFLFYARKGETYSRDLLVRIERALPAWKVRGRMDLEAYKKAANEVAQKAS